nr:MAG TPA: hypothetical protein [Caudoviricetes sp.]
MIPRRPENRPGGARRHFRRSGTQWPRREQARRDKSRRLWYNDRGAVVSMAVSHFPERGGDADGRRTLGASPALRGCIPGSPLAAGLHRPKSVLAARLAPGRLTLI